MLECHVLLRCDDFYKGFMFISYYKMYLYTENVMQTLLYVNLH